MIVFFRKYLKIIILFSSIALITAHNGNPPPRSVNVALETSFLFDPKDLHQNKYVVSNFREFLDKLLTVLDPQKPRRRFRAQNKRRDTKLKLGERTDSKERQDMKEKTISKETSETSTGTSINHVIDFVRNVGKTFVNLTGNKIAEAVNNINVQVITEPSQAKFRGSTAILEEFQAKQDEVGKQDIKEIITDSINNWMKRYPEEMRTIMNTTVNVTNPLLKTFARRINNYYDDEDMKKLQKLIKKFKRQIENQKDTTKVVEELLQNAIFQKYSNLNDSTKYAIMEDLKMFSDFLIANNVFKGLREHLTALNRRSMPNHNVETGEIRNIDDMTYTNLRRSIDNSLRVNRAKNEIKRKKKSETNEIDVDSSEFLARSALKP